MVLMKPVVDEVQRSACAEATTQLFEWASGAVHGELPAAMRRRAALILADDVAAMAAASGEPQVKETLLRLVRTSTGPEATVFAPGIGRLDRTSAAVANGMAATWCELDEGLRSVPCHAGAYVLPALLAESEARNLTLAAMLARLAVAYEVVARIATAFPFSSMRVHPHAAFATIGAACGAALARNADPKLLGAAVTGAASMTFAGPYAHAIDGALIRNAWTSAGAWIGLQSVDWAEAGIAGVAHGMYDAFVSCLGADYVPDALTRDLGTAWVAGEGYHKVFACCQYAHSAIEATLELRNRLSAEGRSPDDLRGIHVETHPRGETLTTVEPATVLAAKFSMPHALAASALLGTGGQEAFATKTLDDPRITALRRQVTLAPHPDIRPWPNDRPARVHWRFADGEVWSAERASARGGADRPFDEETLIAKIETNALVVPGLSELLVCIARDSDALAGKSWSRLIEEHLRER
jgi:2-methylcitrate dehydratase PrpD